MLFYVENDIGILIGKFIEKIDIPR